MTLRYSIHALLVSIVRVFAAPRLGKKERLLPLLEAAPAVLKWLHIAGISADNVTTPLFPAFERDRKTPSSRPLSRRQILNIVKKYAAEAA